MKRFLVDWIGNYIFFVPIVILINGWAWHWDLAIIVPYMITSIALAGITGRLFTAFLKWVWYPLCRERF